MIGKMIAIDCQTFSIVEDEGFINLVNELQISYHIPSYKFFSTTLIPELFDKCKEAVEKIIQLPDFIALITLTKDIWSLREHDSVIDFTGHFIVDRYIRKHCLLQASKFNERHTADSIVKMFTHCVSQWGIQSKL